MYRSYARAILIGVGLCTAGATFAETSAPPMPTVQEVEAGALFPLVPGKARSGWSTATERDGKSCWN